MSHLLQMRGLKHRDAAVFKLQQESHLLQMRGLKHLTDAQKTQVEQSHLLQMRGLKHRDAAVFKLQQESHLLQMRGLKRELAAVQARQFSRIFYRCVD